MKTKKFLAVLISGILMAALLSGCGGMNRYQTMELETETEAA